MIQVAAIPIWLNLAYSNLAENQMSINLAYSNSEDIRVYLS